MIPCPAPRRARRPAVALIPAAALALALLCACGSGPTLSPAADAAGRPTTLIKRQLRGPAAAAEIERATDDSDRQKLWHALSLTRNPVPVGWRNAATGRDFVLAPLSGHAGAHGACRDFQLDVTHGGSTDRLLGTACEHEDARWRLLR